MRRSTASPSNTTPPGRPIPRCPARRPRRAREDPGRRAHPRDRARHRQGHRRARRARLRARGRRARRGACRGRPPPPRGFPAARIVVADFEQLGAGARRVRCGRRLHVVPLDRARAALLRRPRDSFVPAARSPSWTRSTCSCRAPIASSGSLWRAIFTDVAPHPDNGLPPAPDEVGDLREEIEASGLFRRGDRPQAALERQLHGRRVRRPARDVFPHARATGAATRRALLADPRARHRARRARHETNARRPERRAPSSGRGTPCAAPRPRGGRRPCPRARAGPSRARSRDRRSRATRSRSARRSASRRPTRAPA